jgi:ferredoxin
MERRVSHCWKCKKTVDSEQHNKCGTCGWIICRCGACEKNCPVGEGARSIEEERAAREKIDLAVKYQDKIKRACDRLQDLELADDKSVTTFFIELILKMRSEILDSTQFDNHYWSLAERIKDQIAVKSSNPEMRELLHALRDKMIRLAPGRLEKSAKAFFQV